MLRSPAVCSVVVLLAACVAHAPAASERASSPTATPAPSVAALRMVKPPVAVYHDRDGYLDVWVRLNRPIGPADIAPDANGDRVVSLEALEGESLFGTSADVRFPTCYSDGLVVGAAPAAGTRVEITVDLGPTRNLKGTAAVQDLTHDTHPARELGCPRDPDGHVCAGKVGGRYLTILLETAYAASCREARRVMASVGRWANPHRCPWQLCVSRHRMNRGFRCDAHFHNGGEGPPAWQIECTKGRARITAYADEA